MTESTELTDLLDVVRRVLATAAARLPPEDERELCDSVAALLERRLRDEQELTRHDWLDGFVALEAKKSPDFIFLRGGIWVNAVRPEPCEAEVEVTSTGAARIQIRFMNGRGPSTVDEIWKLRFPIAQWRYRFDDEVMS